MEDFGKIAVLAAIMGALLIAGLLFRTTDSVEPVEAVAVAEPVEVVEEVMILPQETLELLDPVYSEKAVYQDDTIRVAFNASYADDGIESRLPFWLHNTSDEVINVLWDRCSIQLPSGNTVKIVNEGSALYLGMESEIISIAPAGDLFDAAIPVTEIAWTEEGWTLSDGVLDEGMFTFVLAIEKGVDCPSMIVGEWRGPRGDEPTGCGDSFGPAGRSVSAQKCPHREIVYYSFRFIVR